MSPQRLSAHHCYFVSTLKPVRRLIVTTAMCLSVVVGGMTAAVAQEASAPPAGDTPPPSGEVTQATQTSTGATTDTAGEQTATPTQAPPPQEAPAAASQPASETTSAPAAATSTAPTADQTGPATQETPQPSAPASGDAASAPASGQPAASAEGSAGNATQTATPAQAPSPQEAPAAASQPTSATPAAAATGTAAGATAPAAGATPTAAPATGTGQAGEQKASAESSKDGAAASGKADQAANKGGTESEKVLKNQEKPPEQDTGLQSLGINLISNKIQLDITESYVHTTNNQIFIEGFGVIPILVVGNVTVQQVRKDLFTTTAALRYRVTDKLQAELRVPWQYTIVRQSVPTGLSSNAVLSPNKDTLGYSNGFGDISIGVNYSIKDEGLSTPSLLGGLTFKGRNGRDIFDSPDASLHPPTGSGFFSLGGSLSASKTSAPAIVYGSVGYNYAFARKNVVFTPSNQPPVLVNFTPGNNFNISMGVAISLNYNFTLNMSYAQSVNLTSEINGRKLANSATDAITLRIGGTWRFSPKRSADVGVSFGVTPDAPDFRLDIRLPWKFGNA